MTLLRQNHHPWETVPFHFLIRLSPGHPSDTVFLDSCYFRPRFVTLPSHFHVPLDLPRHVFGHLIQRHLIQRLRLPKKKGPQDASVLQKRQVSLRARHYSHNAIYSERTQRASHWWISVSQICQTARIPGPPVGDPFGSLFNIFYYIMVLLNREELLFCFSPWCPSIKTCWQCSSQRARRGDMSQICTRRLQYCDQLPL